MTSEPTRPTGPASQARAVPPYFRVGKYKIPVPHSRPLRVALGCYLILAGFLPFVPPGAGAIPVGITILSLDYPKLRRPRRRMVVWGGRRLKAALRLLRPAH